ncbi:MAG: oleate hydratase [Rickettsiales bacterium]|nr:oleate hydratase [Rickettsiales bacterium]
MIEKPSHTLAIIGGGISGLTAAYYAIEKGQDPKSITIYEAGTRLGGRIQSLKLGERNINMGAEFIDSDHNELIALCNRFGIALEPTQDQENELFQLPNGKQMKSKDFHNQFTPLRDLINLDREEMKINPKGATSKRLDNISMQDYLTELLERVQKERPRSWTQFLVDTATFSDSRDKSEIIDMIKGAFSSELGRPPSQISAFQFINECSDQPDSLLSSDCGFRAQGGTERVIEELEKYLKEKGVEFKTSQKLQSLEKHGDKISLELLGSTEAHIVQTDQMVLALPTYALASIKGLDKLGFSSDLLSSIMETQYTDNNMKLTVALKPGASVKKANMFSANGFQAWIPQDGVVTFLIARREGENPKQAIERVTEQFAASYGKKADDLFMPRTTENLLFSAPTSKQSCYATPAPGQYTALKRVKSQMEQMPNNGVVITGTYLPIESGEGMGVGFMECGIKASQRAVEKLMEHKKTRPVWLENTLENRPADVSHTASLVAPQEAAARGGIQ